MGGAASDLMTSQIEIKNNEYKDYYGYINLHKAAAKGDFHGVRICLKKGADPNERYQAQEDTVMIYACRGFKTRGGTPSHLKVIKLLQKHGASLHRHNILQQSPLHFAAQKGHLKIVTYLLSQGCNIDKPDQVGRTPLHYAISENNVKMVRLLIDSDATIFRPRLNFVNFTNPFIDACTDDSEVKDIVTKAYEKQEEEFQQALQDEEDALEIRQVVDEDTAASILAERNRLRAEQAKARKASREAQARINYEKRVALELKKSVKDIVASEKKKEAFRTNGVNPIDFRNGKWKKKVEEEWATWEYVKNQSIASSASNNTVTSNFETPETRRMWEEAEEMMKVLWLRKQRLRPTLATAPTSFTQYQNRQEETFDKAKWESLSVHRPQTVPISSNDNDASSIRIPRSKNKRKVIPSNNNQE